MKERIDRKEYGNTAGGGAGPAVLRLPAAFLVFAVRLYQVTLSPYIGNQCRFVPTCSEYFIQAVRYHGALKGSVLGTWRILRCHPFSRGGYDPVPQGEETALNERHFTDRDF